MIDAVSISLAVSSFICSLYFVKLSKHVDRVMHLRETVLDSLTILFAGDKDDHEKEKFLRRAGIEIIKSSSWLLLMVGISLSILCSGPVFVFLTNTQPIDEVVAQTLSISSVIISALFFAFGTWLFRNASENEQATGRYSRSEQTIHSIAMSRWVLSKLSNLDMAISRKTDDRALNPIFILGIARSGSTALLNALFSFDDLGTYTYRCMPFVTIPKISSYWMNFQKGKTKGVERAHGDGHMISLNTPEAFDEILWKLKFPQVYQDHWIEQLKSTDIDKACVDFFNYHAGAIAEAVGKAKLKTHFSGPFRYISKNNANISRLDALNKIFPTAQYVVPFRDPLDHSKSLLNQHLRFLDLHKEDNFALRYMNDLGHFEFGMDLKCLTLGKPFQCEYQPDDLNYWLHYWCYAYSFIISQKEVDIIYLDLRSLIADERSTMKKLAKKLTIVSEFDTSKKYFKNGQVIDVKQKIDYILLEESRQIYDKLCLNSLR